ncbi:hypothetical protein [Bifidobacterium sp. ESL0745]|uniref:hypothetical protein n=1 Tax=Bifidobacterium sp. ESL0745 TaxID=2983226 RepID=UPI0023F9FBFA|nr:hypothetical protein [Bifidobacterium sp. ESL0745]MDF7665733.1 hypothetical protein [Bifidobacterium sp. ESL0745]
MGITIKRPTEDFEVVTDLDALRRALESGAAIPKIDTDDHTESEIASLRKQQADAIAKAKELKDKTDESTLVISLRGLTCSEWNLIVLKNTDTKDGKIVKDWVGMVRDSLPRMIQSAHWKGKTEEITLDGIEGLFDSMVDSQVADLLQVVQSLNAPRNMVPKELRELVSQNA